MNSSHTDSNILFLAGGGEMGKLTRDKDWSKTSLGSPQFWPQSLRTTLSIILSSKFPMFLFWGEELICFYNDAYRPSLGNEGKHPSILGMPAVDAWVEIWPTIKPLIDQVLAGGEATWSEDQLIPIFRNGKIEDVYWTFSYSPVNDESGKPAGVFVTCTETTEKILTLKKIEVSKNELEFAIEATELGTWDYNPETGKFSSNDRLKEWFGLPAKTDLELSHAINAILETDRKTVVESIEKALEFSSGGSYDIEYTIVNAITREEKIVHAKGRAWFNNENIAYRFNGTLEDITQAAIAAEKTKESEQRFAAAVQAVEGIVWTNNEKGEMSGEQAGWAELTGQSYNEYQGYGWSNAVHPEDVQANIETWQEAVRDVKIFNFEHRVKVRDGSWRTFSVRAIPLKNDDGTLREWVGVHTDIQKQKTFAFELERQVKERTKELAANNVELERMNKELQSFAYISSHDLQEPLRKIQTFVSRIIENEKGNLSDAGIDYFNRMQNAALRMQTLIDDLLSYSRTNSIDRKFEITELDEIIEEVKADLQEELNQKNATIISTASCTLSIIPFQFRQLLHNLFSNSMKFSSPARPLLISIKSNIADGIESENKIQQDQTKYCHLNISDNGIGFEPAYSEKIFELFQRLHGRHEYNGTGIGLAIVKKIVENHNGIIKATGAPGKGASFDIYIPVSSNQ